MKKSKLFLLPLFSAPLVIAGCGSDFTPAGPVAVTGVTLSKSELVLKVGSEYQLKATISPSNAANSLVTWSSSN